MKLTIETEKGNFDIQEDQFVIRKEFKNFPKEGYYFNYCILILYTKNFRSKFDEIKQIDKIILKNDNEFVEINNLHWKGGYGSLGLAGDSEEIKTETLSNLLDKNNFNKILESYFKESYEELYKLIKKELMEKIDLKCQIGLNVYLSLKA